MALCLCWFELLVFVNFFLIIVLDSRFLNQSLHVGKLVILEVVRVVHEGKWTYFIQRFSFLDVEVLQRWRQVLRRYIHALLRGFLKAFRALANQGFFVCFA